MKNKKFFKVLGRKPATHNLANMDYTQNCSDETLPWSGDFSYLPTLSDETLPWSGDFS